MAKKQNANDIIKKDIKKLNVSDSFYLVDEKTKAVNKAIGKKLYKRAAAIYWSNVVFFVLLCIGAFIFVVAPLFLWLFGYKVNESNTNWYKLIVTIGLPWTVVTALYGGLVFWVLMTKVRQFSEANHRIFIYMGVLVTIVCVDDKIITYIKNGYMMDPTCTCYFKLGKNEICRFRQKAKYDFKIDFNWYTSKTYERFEQHINYYNKKKSKKGAR